MNSDMSLPDDIVRHIQSFMNFKDSARSATLSSHLYHSWYSSKRLDLDERQFRDGNAFWIGAHTTLERYLDANLQLESFTLRLVCGHERYYSCQKLLRYVSELGVQEIDIRVLNDNFNIFIHASVISTDKLVKFSLMGGGLNIAKELPVCCTSLQTLSLLPSHIIGYRGDLLTNYVLQCPCLKHLSCPGFLLYADFCSLENDSHDLESLTIHNLDYEDNAFLAKIFIIFRRLQKLTIRQVLNDSLLHICSDSLEHISIQDRYRSVAAVLRVPKLTYFHFVGVASSCLTVESTSGVFLSDINIVCFGSNAHWITSLHKLLRCLSSSRIYLSVRIKYDISNFKHWIKCDGEAVNVEELDLVTVSPHPQIVDSLFCVCMPERFIYNHAVQ